MSKHEQFGEIATLLDVNVADVIEMDKRLNIPLALNRNERNIRCYD
jgi:DNA-directed RNA polymerase sigma subunit (sigma70/sigma32)